MDLTTLPVGSRLFSHALGFESVADSRQQVWDNTHLTVEPCLDGSMQYVFMGRLQSWQDDSTAPEQEDRPHDSMEIPVTWARYIRQIPSLHWESDVREHKLLNCTAKCC